ncbi:MAG TPA: VWA domain-containing protein [Candidatus Angelobacter sp.]|nr:VWA domain-containing protein [Candidatus Angelobacter sp.]
MKLRGFLLIIFLIGCYAGAEAQGAPPNSAPPQTGNPPASQQLTPPSTGDTPTDPESFKKVVDIVPVIFTVTDKHGKFISDLQQRQLKILDNNKPPREVIKFEAQTDLPLRVGLLIDASNSIRDRFLFEQQAASEFLHQVIRSKADEAFVLAFDEIAETAQESTNDLDKLTKGIRSIRPGGGTALWDAVYYACRDKLLKQQNKGPVRKVIVLVSDGDDNQSRVLRQEAIEMAQRAEVIIYTISTNLSNIQDTGDHNLKMLAEATGGQAFTPFKLQDLASDFNSIQGELRSQYYIAYKPTDLLPNGQFRPIQIVAEDKKLKVRAKKGYYARTE